MPKMNFITIKIICLKPPGNPIVASVKIITVKLQTPTSLLPLPKLIVDGKGPRKKKNPVEAADVKNNSCELKKSHPTEWSPP